MGMWFGYFSIERFDNWYRSLIVYHITMDKFEVQPQTRLQFFSSALVTDVRNVSMHWLRMMCTYILGTGLWIKTTRYVLPSSFQYMIWLFSLSLFGWSKIPPLTSRSTSTQVLSNSSRLLSSMVWQASDTSSRCIMSHHIQPSKNLSWWFLLLPLVQQQYVQVFIVISNITDALIQVLCHTLWMARRQEGKDECWQPEG